MTICTRTPGTRLGPDDHCPRLSCEPTGICGYGTGTGIADQAKPENRFDQWPTPPKAEAISTDYTNLRSTYRLTETEAATLRRISTYESADDRNAYWLELGLRHGFIWTTVDYLEWIYETGPDQQLTGATFKAMPEKQAEPDFTDATDWYERQLAERWRGNIVGRYMVLEAFNAGRDKGFAMGASCQPIRLSVLNCDIESREGDSWYADLMAGRPVTIDGYRIEPRERERPGGDGSGRVVLDLALIGGDILAYAARKIGAAFDGLRAAARSGPDDDAQGLSPIASLIDVAVRADAESLGLFYLSTPDPMFKPDAPLSVNGFRFEPARPVQADRAGLMAEATDVMARLREMVGGDASPGDGPILGALALIDRMASLLREQDRMIFNDRLGLGDDVRRAEQAFETASASLTAANQTIEAMREEIGKLHSRIDRPKSYSWTQRESAISVLLQALTNGYPARAIVDFVASELGLLPPMTGGPIGKRADLIIGDGSAEVPAGSAWQPDVHEIRPRDPAPTHRSTPAFARRPIAEGLECCGDDIEDAATRQTARLQARATEA